MKKYGEDEKKKLGILETQLKQVSTYYIPPDKKSTSTKMGFQTGVFNEVQRQWKERRMDELKKEIEQLKGK